MSKRAHTGPRVTTVSNGLLFGYDFFAVNYTATIQQALLFLEKAFAYSGLSQAGQQLGIHGSAPRAWLPTLIQSPACFTWTVQGL